MTHATASCSASCSPRKPHLSLLSRLRLLWTVRRQRNQLAALDERALRDIGVTRAEADAEARRGFWSAPSHWLR
ncbi:DUF1127 domain-containing protein [Leisingera aquaemixtae]|uniref:DUF1127 domain-containing protein n=1 Tax=Leisingera aquaemixtae TaxID=1396826 RepID=A0ABY5WME4_9RHOB|nr:DUF1127 domain-containing protein [Leisingera aquaemixtae]UWQ42605.1 DUF1127 domain-containing protein [Leisingera aquaemixtae]